jgi:hypothetical protein
MNSIAERAVIPACAGRAIPRRDGFEPAWTAPPIEVVLLRPERWLPPRRTAVGQMNDSGLRGRPIAPPPQWLATHRRRPQSSQRTIARRLPSDVLRRAPVAAHTSPARRLLDSRAFQLTPRLGHASTGVRSRPNALACGLLAAAFVSLWRSGKATRMAKLSVDSSLGDSVSSNSASSARRDCLSCASSARPESVMSTSVTRPSSGSMSLTTKSSRSSRPTNCVIAG